MPDHRALPTVPAVLQPLVPCGAAEAGTLTGSTYKKAVRSGGGRRGEAGVAPHLPPRDASETRDVGGLRLGRRHFGISTTWHHLLELPSTDP